MNAPEPVFSPGLMVLGGEFSLGEVRAGPRTASALSSKMNSLPPRPRLARAALTALGLAAPTACLLLAPHEAAFGLAIGGYTLVGLLAIAIRDYSWRGSGLAPSAAPAARTSARRHATSPTPACRRRHTPFGDGLRKQTHAQ